MAKPGRINLSVNRRKEAFIAAYAMCGLVNKAAAVAGVSPGKIRAWAQQDEKFATAIRDAELEFAEVLEEEAIKRAITGNEHVELHKGEPIEVWVDSKGEIVPSDFKGVKRRAVLKRSVKSDLLMMFLLKGIKPDKYRERTSLDVTSGGKAVKQFIGVDTDQV